MRWNTVGLALLAVAGAGLAGAAGFTGWFFLDDHVGPDMPFQPQAWKAAPLYGDDETRLRMVRDLRRKRRLEGMTKQEVVALLGPPSEHAGGRVVVPVAHRDQATRGVRDAAGLAAALH